MYSLSKFSQPFLTVAALSATLAGLMGLLYTPLTVQAAPTLPIDRIKGIPLTVTTGITNCNPQGNNPTESTVYNEPGSDGGFYLLPLTIDEQENAYISQSNSSHLLRRVAPDCTYTEWRMPSDYSVAPTFSDNGIYLRGGQIYLQYYQTSTNTYFLGTIDQSSTQLKKVYAFPVHAPQAIALSKDASTLFFSDTSNDQSLYIVNLKTQTTNHITNFLPSNSFIMATMADAGNNLYQLVVIDNDVHLYTYKPSGAKFHSILNNSSEKFSFMNASLLEYNGEVRLYTSRLVFNDDYTIHSGVVDEVKLAPSFSSPRPFYTTAAYGEMYVKTSNITGQVHVGYNVTNGTNQSITTLNLNGQVTRTYSYPSDRGNTRASYFVVSPNGNYYVNYSDFSIPTQSLLVVKAVY